MHTIDQVRNTASRVQINSADASGSEQYYAVEGMSGESFTEVLAIQQHGFASTPPAGSHALMVAVNGRRDLCVVVGGESPGARPTGVPAGGATMYDGKSTVALDAAGNATVTAPNSIKLTVGGCTLTISASGFAFQGGTITHNGQQAKQFTGNGVW